MSADVFVEGAVAYAVVLVGWIGEALGGVYCCERIGTVGLAEYGRWRMSRSSGKLRIEVAAVRDIVEM
jgi:hypothetical protein